MTVHRYPVRNLHRWTPEEDALLRDLYPQGRYEELRAKIPVSQDSLKSRACLLKLLSPKSVLEAKNRELLKDGKRQCNKCGLVLSTDHFYVNTHYGTFDHTCHTCRCSGAVKTVEARFQRMRALRLGPITLDQLKAKWDQQQGICYYSGERMTFAGGDDTLVSVDRIDSNLGYTNENTVLCCYQVNIMKNTTEKEKFVLWCKRVASKT
jgi:hypothetical protein